MADKATQTRPTGVTVICILGFLGAILGILGAVALIGLGGLSGYLAGMEGAAMLAFLGPFMGVIGALLLIISVITFVAVYWLWQMKKIGWTITMIMEIISILLSIAAFNILGLVIPAIIVIYLWMKKDLFK